MLSLDVEVRSHDCFLFFSPPGVPQGNGAWPSGIQVTDTPLEKVGSEDRCSAPATQEPDAVLARHFNGAESLRARAFR